MPSYWSEVSDFQAEAAASLFMKKNLMSNKESTELERLLENFTVSPKMQENIKSFISITRKIKKEGEESVLSKYISTLKHSKRNDGTLRSFEKEIRSRVQNYINTYKDTNTIKKTKNGIKKGFSKSLKIILSYDNTRDASEAGIRRRKDLSAQLKTKTDAYEILLYGRMLGMEGLVINKWDERILSDKEVEEALNKSYYALTENLRGEKLYSAMAKDFQERTYFSISTTQVKDYLKKTDREEPIILKNKPQLRIIPRDDLPLAQHA